MLLFLFLSLVFSKTFILTPKPIVSILDMDTFNLEHDIYHLANLGDLTLYQTNNTKFLGTLEQLFDIEEDQIYKVGSVRKFIKNTYDDFTVYFSDNKTVPWHLDRIVKENLPLDNKFEIKSCNTNKDITINSYVVDTGSLPLLANFADSTDKDCHGHGSFCTSVIKSVCKDANVFGVKVLDCNGSGRTSDIIKGLDFVYKKHQETKKSKGVVKSIVNMSLGGGFSKALNRAVESSIKDLNFYFVAAAGNENQSIKRVSPASSKGIIAAMASDRNDNRAYFSNFDGTIYAPGVDIQGVDQNDVEQIWSGTSFSSPITVAVVNKYLNMYPDLNQESLVKQLSKDSSKNKIKQNKKNTVNELIYLY